jgi:hypothetical protein
MASRRPLLLAAFLALLGGGALVVTQRSAAGEGQPYRLVYVSVSGEGPNAKAWYDGAPPSGTPVQAALDRFTQDGFRYVGSVSTGRGGQPVVVTSAAASPESNREANLVILLERR